MFDPDSFRHTHEKILKAIGAEHIRFHDLRHTFATLSLKYGVDVKTLSGALGHYDAGFTLSTYTHATAEMKRAPPTPSETSSVRQCKYKKIPREGRMILSAPLPYFRRLGQRLGICAKKFPISNEIRNFLVETAGIEPVTSCV